VDFVVVGSFSLFGGEEEPLLRLDLRLLDTSSGEVLAAESATGTERQLFDLVNRAGRSFRQRLDAGGLSPAQALEVQASLPADPQATRLYCQGLDRLRVADAQAARDLLEKAVEADPDFPLSHAALASAWSDLGYESGAREAASRAMQLSAALPQQERLLIEAQFHLTAKRWEQAIETYSSLFQLFPDDIDYGLRLATAQSSAGRHREALVTLEKLRALPSPLSNDPRIDLGVAFAHYRLGDLRQVLGVTQRAVARGKELDAGLVVARARIMEACALQVLGRHEEALTALEEARTLFEARDDYKGLAQALDLMATSVHAEGELSGALRLLERSLAMYQELGDLRGTARLLHNMGNVLVDQGKLDEADRLYDEAGEIFAEIGSRWEAAAMLSELGTTLLEKGQLAAAQQRYQEALNLFGELGDRSSVAVALTNLAEVFYQRGELDRARDMHEEALAINREIGDRSGAAYDTFRLAEVFAARGDLFVSRERYLEALGIQEELGETIAAAETRVGLARLELVEGRAEEAERLARQAEEVLRVEGATDLAALTTVVLSRALLAQGRFAEARQEVERARKVGETSDIRRVRLATAILGARLRSCLETAEGVAATLRELETIATEAAAAGDAVSGLEARLAMAEVEMAAGMSDRARARLDELAGDARDRGFGQIARRASAVGAQ
jgi:tetratricopeptide (TPR) repeat protein